MSSDRIYLHYLQDILENADKALQFVQGMNQDDCGFRKYLEAGELSLQSRGKNTRGSGSKIGAKLSMSAIFSAFSPRPFNQLHHLCATRVEPVETRSLLTTPPSGAVAKGKSFCLQTI